MKGVRLTKAEVARVRQWHGEACKGEPDKVDQSILAKLAAAETAPVGVAVKPIEDALIKSSHGKVVALQGGFPRASRQLTALGATVEQAELIGAYMARQAWLTSPMTVLDVANKWDSWLPKALATAPPPSLGPGLGTGQGPAQAGKATQGRRQSPGFR